MLLEQEFEDFEKTLEGLDAEEREKRVYYFGMFIMLAHLEELEEYVGGVRDELRSFLLGLWGVWTKMKLRVKY